jgi:hypothetical protein
MMVMADLELDISRLVAVTSRSAKEADTFLKTVGILLPMKRRL